MSSKVLQAVIQCVGWSVKQNKFHAGYLVYHGPRESVLDFFEPLGFRCPERKGVADFLQEVTSRKDQQVILLFNFATCL